jgi:uncharacterized protein Yka (UPF0111/DUF47 family)
MSNIKIFNKAFKELRKGNEKAAHEIAKDIKVTCKYEDEIEKMRKKV